MPLYTIKCAKCEGTGTQKLSFIEYDEIQGGKKRLECECGGLCTIEFNPGGVAFVMKDGPSGGWTSKAMKENKYRSGHREVMAKRERDHVFKTKLIPNYNGEETGTWREAQEVARKNAADSTLAAVAASTYAPLVKKELQST